MNTSYIDPSTEPLKDPEPAVAKDYMHMDDFLNGVANEGQIEMAAAFGARARLKGWVKLEPSEWRTKFEEFSNEIPR